jgi:DNA polymerase V
MSEQTKTHGGRRLGAGRKPGSGIFGEPTSVMRVPVSQIGEVRNFLNARRQPLRQSALANVAEIGQLQRSAHTTALPLYGSKVAAGYPASVDDHVERRLDPSEYLVQDATTTFFVRVKGDSMIDAGIFEDDVLVVDRSCQAQVGDIVLALLDGEFTVKTLGRTAHGMRLIPANSNYPVIDIGVEQSFEVWGVITGSMRKFR